MAQTVEKQPELYTQPDNESKSGSLNVTGSLLDEHQRAIKAFQASEEHFSTFMSNVPIILFTLDLAGVFTLSEGRGLEALGLRPGELAGCSVFKVYRDFPQTLDHLRRALAGETLKTIDRMNNLIFEMQLAPLFNSQARQIGVIGVSIDIRDRVQAEEALQVREQQFRALTEQASDLVFVLDPIGMYRYVSPSHQRILGYAPEELVDLNIFALLHPSDLSQALTAFAGAFQTSGENVRLECRLRHKDGSWVALECVGNNCLNDPALEGLIVNARDVTERVAMEQALRHSALYDALTDLPNRTLLQQRLDQALQDAKPMESETALLTMDIDRFKDVNDTFGHHHGDLLLQQVGMRLLQIVSSSGTVARLGGDEFAMLLPFADETKARTIAAALRTALEEPFQVADNPLQIEASIGIALSPAHGADSITLLRRADIAMYIAKRTHEGYGFYDPESDTNSLRRIALANSLRHAIPANELRLYYQPKVDLKTGLTHSVEALVRWQHPELGFIPPDQFIPLAEQTGLITHLSLWVLETAAQQCSKWLQDGLEICIAVNLSMWDLRDTALPDTISTLLARYKLPTRLLRVELTESAVMTDTERAFAILARLSQLGVQISIDDFGTGYSSLAYLKRLPVNELKIDRSFVQHIASNESDATIVRSTISLAHNLGLRVVAEGIEDRTAWDILAAFGCDTGQGYYMSRPIPASDFERWRQETKFDVAS